MAAPRRVAMPATRRADRITSPSRCHHRLLLPVLLLQLVLLLPVGPVAGDILVYTRNAPQLLVEEFRDMPANFGPRLPDTGLQVIATAGWPSDGCDTLMPPPGSSTGVGSAANATRWPFVVIVAR